ncbi:MAG: YidC/Oxa1 family membrane protein insertase [Actinomycetota bacterium]|nr:YidC/Oxa1 family membrane protein insertase [Actinomycetota bacterium]
MIVAGPLAPIEEILEAVLVWLHETGALPWAWAIVALTIIVRMLLVPLTVRQIHSMQNLQKHAPEMKALQQRWKHDKVRQREELMKFYKENNINPASSCLPIVAQIPIFLALFFVLRDFDNEVIRPRFPDSDLGWLGLVPNITADANSHWSGYLLLAIYAISQTTSTLLMATTMDRMQRTLLLIFPLAFLFFILNFPSGLVLYWVTTNLWTTGQGLVTRRLMPKPVTPPKRSSRTAPKEERVEAEVAKPAGKASQAQVRRVKRKKKARR